MAIYRMDFESMFEARKALIKLKELGYKKAYLDMFDKHGVEFAEELTVDIPEKPPAYSSAILRSGKSKASMGKEPLVAKNPFTGGVGSLCELSGNKSASLYVDFDDDKTEEVKKILNDQLFFQ